MNTESRAVDLSCPCGADHSHNEGWSILATMVGQCGPLIRVQAPGGTWSVPRVFIAIHGLKANELAALADKYGWTKVR